MKQDKRIERLLSKPTDYTFSEAKALLESFGYQMQNKGTTSGARVMFYRLHDDHKILLHKPHPKDTMKSYAVKQLIDVLKEKGDIDG